MQVGLLRVSQIFGLIPFNHMNRNFKFYDYFLMFIVPCIYIYSYLMATLEYYSVKNLKLCGSICTLGNTLFIHLGIFVYMIDYILSLFRGKYFFPEFYKRLNEIDQVLKKCSQNVKANRKSMNLVRTFVVTALIIGFLYAIYFDVTFQMGYYGNYFIVATMAVTFPFVASSIVQAQFVYLVAIISERFTKLNFLLETLNKECSKKNLPIRIFDIETDVPLKKSLPMHFQKGKKESKKDMSDNEDWENTSDSEIEQEKSNQFPEMDSKTSEEFLVDLFKLHDKILTLCRLTNHEYGAQTVPYMVVCFVISIFGIFLETKVIFVAGGRSALLDYVAQIYVTWSLITIVVAYLVLRLCCNANGYSRQSAMIVHEIMQKKPQFMMGNDIYYNKMKSFTLQFLHWEGFFQFNGIGMFTLDYTFIFSTVSAATSYLIVLLQFDMTKILRDDGLINN